MGYLKTEVCKQSENQMEPAKAKSDEFKPKQAPVQGKKVKVGASVNLETGEHNCE